MIKDPEPLLSTTNIIIQRYGRLQPSLWSVWSTINDRSYCHHKPLLEPTLPIYTCILTYIHVYWHIYMYIYIQLHMYLLWTSLKHGCERLRCLVDYLTFKSMVETLRMFNIYAMMLVNELCINQPLYRAEWLKSEQIGWAITWSYLKR